MQQQHDKVPSDSIHHSALNWDALLLSEEPLPLRMNVETKLLELFGIQESH